MRVVVIGFVSVVVLAFVFGAVAVVGVMVTPEYSPPVASVEPSTGFDLSTLEKSPKTKEESISATLTSSTSGLLRSKKPYDAPFTKARLGMVFFQFLLILS